MFIDVIICRCQTGLLDSPLALMSHASAFPTATNTFKGSRKRHFGGANLLPFPSLFATPNILTPRTTTASRGNIPPRGESGIENAISTTQPLYMPGGHPPLSAEVYEHVSQYFDIIDVKTFSGLKKYKGLSLVVFIWSYDRQLWIVLVIRQLFISYLLSHS